ASGAESRCRIWGGAVWFLHTGDDFSGQGAAGQQSASDRAGDPPGHLRQSLSLHRVCQNRRGDPGRGTWLGGAMRVVGVVLAAGESRRMGRLKALLPFGAHTVIEHVLQPLLQADLAAVAVVLGHRAADIAAVLENLPVHLLHIPQYHHGMTTSVQVALRDITPVPDAYLLALVHQRRPHRGLSQKLLPACTRTR